MAAKKKQRIVPKTPSVWDTASRRTGAGNKRPDTRKEFNSASDLTEEEYILLRVLWLEAAIEEAAQGLQLDDELIQRVSDWLDVYTPFQNYLSAIENPDDPPSTDDLQVFAPTYEQQCQILKLLEEPVASAGLDGINEELVNSALVNFITAICIAHPDIDSICSPRRAEIAFKFRVKEDLKLACEVNGFVASQETSKTQLIMEAKLKPREDHMPNVAWQEATEMICAFLEGPPKGLPQGRVILVSQDGNEFYLAHAVPNDKYRDYMTRERMTLKKEDFLRVYQYGPWCLRERQEMEDFATLLLAVILRANEEDEDEDV